MNFKLGFMQGRLVNSEKKNAIQYFPSKNWSKEFKIGNKIDLKIIEWTINKENIKKNPLYNGKLNFLKKIIKKFEMKVPSVTCDYFMQNPFFKKKNLKNKKKILNILKKIIENGNKIGIKYYIFPLVDNSSVQSIAEENYLIREIKKILPFLRKNSKILFETDLRPDKVVNFIKKFRSSKIGINYDTGNSANLNYDFSDEIKYLRFIKNIHIKDREFGGNTVRLGEGNWNYKKFFKLIKRKYNGNFILQTARSKCNNHIKEILINKFFFKNEWK
jgi:sugar phosphate isomerase/epimerase